MVTREMLQRRLLELQRQKASALHTVSSIDGAIQECEGWIAHLDSKEAKPNGKDKFSLEELCTGVAQSDAKVCVEEGQ